jgi:hypothetical protein
MGIQQILSSIGITATPSADATPFDSSKLLIAILRSPGQLSIQDGQGRTLGFNQNPTIPNGFYVADKKILVIPGFDDGDYQVNIVGNGESGKYELDIGNLSGGEPIWKSFVAKVTPHDTDSYQVFVDATGLDLQPFENQIDMGEYVQDLVTLINDDVQDWTGPEGVRANRLADSLMTDFSTIIESGDVAARELAIRDMENSTKMIREMAVRLSRSANLEDSLFDALGLWYRELVLNNASLTNVDWNRDYQYFLNKKINLENQMASQSAFVTTEDLSELNNFTDLLGQANATSSANITVAFQTLYQAGLWFRDLVYKFQ